MQFNHLQSNNTHNASFAPNPAAAANQQQGANPQGSSVPPLQSAADLSKNPAAKNIQTYHTSSVPPGAPDPLAPDNWNLPEYQPIQPGAPYMEKLADEAMNTKKLNIYLKNARDNEELEDFSDAEEAYEKALKYTENAEHYKLYAGCLREIYLALSKIPLTPAKDEAKERLYKEKAAKAFYYLGDLYQKQGALQEAQAAYRASSELALYELPLKALLEVSQKLKIKEDITGALEKLSDFYAEKGDTALAIEKLEEALQVEQSSPLLEKLAALHGQAGGEDSQAKVNETRIHQFELQINQDPKNIGLYRDYAWFLKSIGKQDEARVIKKRIDGLLQQNFQTLQQKVIKQKARIEFLERQVTHLDFSSRTDIQDADLISLLKKNPHIKLLNLESCRNITDAGLAALKGLQRLTELNLSWCDQITDAGFQNLAGLNQLRELNLHYCHQLSDAGLEHLTGLTQLKELYLSECHQLTDAGLEHLSGLTQLASLNLNCCDQLTDAGLAHLRGLTQLTSLNLYNCNKLTDGGLQHLRGLSQLTYLNLHGCRQLSDVGLQHLRGLSQLTYLNLHGCRQLSDVGLQHLAGLTQLTSLVVSGNITDAGLQHLVGLTQLSYLNLCYCTQLTDAGLKHLAGLTQLTSLNLCYCTQLTDAGLQHLAGLTQLTSLNLYGCKQLTDAGLQHLAGLTQLKTLDLQGIQLTSNAKEQLKRQIPGLTITE